MNENTDKLTNSEWRKKAILLVQRLQNSGLETEVIYARLAKQGVPSDIAKEAVNNVILEFKQIDKKEAKTSFNSALISIGLGIGTAIISLFVVPGYVFIPFVLIASGVIYALMAQKKME